MASGDKPTRNHLQSETVDPWHGTRSTREAWESPAQSSRGPVGWTNDSAPNQNEAWSCYGRREQGYQNIIGKGSIRIIGKRSIRIFSGPKGNTLAACSEVPTTRRKTTTIARTSPTAASSITRTPYASASRSAPRGRTGTLFNKRTSSSGWHRNVTTPTNYESRRLTSSSKYVSWTSTAVSYRAFSALIRTTWTVYYSHRYGLSPRHFYTALAAATTTTTCRTDRPLGRAISFKPNASADTDRVFVESRSINLGISPHARSPRPPPAAAATTTEHSYPIHFATTEPWAGLELSRGTALGQSIKPNDSQHSRQQHQTYKPTLN